LGKKKRKREQLMNLMSSQPLGRWKMVIHN
jgi:hypothetical protein